MNFIVEASCNKLAITSNGDSSNSNRNKYGSIFGTYEFKFYDNNGFAVYHANNDQKDQYLSKNKNENWMVNKFYFVVFSFRIYHFKFLYAFITSIFTSCLTNQLCAN